MDVTDIDLDKFSGWWNGALEFSLFMGLAALDPDMTEPDVDEWLLKSKYEDELTRKVEAYTGPHGDALFAAYKVRRYSLWGKVTSPIYKTFHAMFLLRAMCKVIFHEFKRRLVYIRLYYSMYLPWK
jgi:hypothetical protein